LRPAAVGEIEEPKGSDYGQRRAYSVWRGGEGPTLLMLHGNGSSLDDFASSLLKRACQNYQVIAVDRPGFGGSTRHAGKKWTPAAQADVVALALRRLGIGDYLVFGHSWGTLVALQLALRHAPEVRGLVLASGYYYPTVRPDALLASFPALPIAGALLRQTILPPLVRLLWPVITAHMFGPRDTPPEFSAVMKEISSRPSQLRSTAAESALLLAEALVRPSYRSIEAPTAIIAGGHDRVIDAAEHARRLHGELRNSMLKIVPGVGHMVHHSAGGKVLRMIDQLAEAADRRASLDAGDVPGAGRESKSWGEFQHFFQT
jgi:pimeloyl-ACP methyl ester carboxylesterase